MSERRICKYCGMELSEDVPHGLRQCHLHAVARIAELEEQAWNLNLENERLEEAYFIDETIVPDGSLKPSVRKLLERLEKAETDLSLSAGLIDSLIDRIAELEAVQRWIPVSERLPETDGQYIGYTNIGLVSTHWFVDGRFIVTYSCKQHWLTTPTSWTLESISSGDIYVTHWMPLPESPEESER